MTDEELEKLRRPSPYAKFVIIWVLFAFCLFAAAMQAWNDWHSHLRWYEHRKDTTE